ncbi:hypothetical protein ACJJTC_011614 [Scirpophaga incertulas]
MSDNQQHGRRRVTYTQLLNLWEFLNSHKDVAVGYNKSAQAPEHSKRMWDRVAAILNSIGEGATKTGAEWSKYWVDFKAKLKRKNRLNTDVRNATGEIQSRHETDRLSQPSTSTDGNPVYLDISFDDSDHQYQSPNIIETIEEPTNQPPSPTTPGPPASAVNAPSQAGAAAGNIISIQQRRRQRRQSRITVGEARERIVSASERRAEAEAAKVPLYSRRLQF